MSKSENTNSTESVVPNYNSDETDKDADSDIENGPSTSKKVRGKAKNRHIQVFLIILLNYLNKNG